MKIVLQVQLATILKTGAVSMESRKIALAMFAKTLGVSRVKTRLAKSIGVEHAEEFYRMSILALEETMTRIKANNQDLDIYWALAEKDTSSNIMWKNFKTMWTGEGDLGERLYNISKELLSEYGAYIIIGTDSPHMPEKLIIDTMNLLKNKANKTVVGPSVDGGFYLFASNIMFPKEVWTKVIYSQNDTLKQLLNNMDKNNFQYEFLEQLIDVDEEEDLKDLYRHLLENKNYNNENQNKLLEWIEKIV